MVKLSVWSRQPRRNSSSPTCLGKIHWLPFRQGINNHHYWTTVGLGVHLGQCTEDPVKTIGSCVHFVPHSQWSDWLVTVTDIVLTVCLWQPGLWHGLPGQQSSYTHTRTHSLQSHTAVYKNMRLNWKTCMSPYGHANPWIIELLNLTIYMQLYNLWCVNVLSSIFAVVTSLFIH